MNSDHCPLLLNLKLAERKFQNRPFRFQSIWLSQVIFRTLLEMLGRVKKVKLSDATFVFVNKAKIWNREVFGNVFAKKKRLMARLGGI